MAIGQVLGIPDNSVNVTVKRIGGGFGAKIDQCNIISTAAALAATTIRKPVKIVVDLDTNMTIYGGRDPFYSTYKVGVDDQGLLQAVQATITSDSGYTGTDPNCPLAPDCVPSCYACPNFLVTPQFVLTNTSCNTYCRTPGEWVDRWIDG
ncbi:xanthine dehydrogenase/oxidase-like [Homarus americanus]|uniref:xanthine dehydrogenase/oxidase-like n=1 Tax=Homarus americanus TaxID=6706 RepID=UPI001C486C99|nr:xanthine dehydrogenase/oxidase-like [Homarus americanus]